MIAWLDIETTGLEPRRDLMLEIGIVITDDQLNEVYSRSAVIGYPLVSMVKGGIIAERLDLNDGFVRNMHTANGLLADVQASQSDTWSVEQYMLDLMLPISTIEKPVMAGASIAFDRQFLAIWMPALLDTFHYRSVDVSGIREISRRWRPDLTAIEPEAGKGHRVMSDIRDSINLARFYKQHIFNPEKGTP
jgi:oligoribonuclease